MTQKKMITGKGHAGFIGILMIGILISMAANPIHGLQQPIIHTLCGYVSYAEGNTTVIDALVSATNTDTGETLENITRVIDAGNNKGGYYQFTLPGYNKPVWDEGSNVRIDISQPTGENSGWQGSGEITLSFDEPHYQLLNITLFPNQPHDDTPPETLLISAPTGIIGYNDASFLWTGSDDTTGKEYLVYQYRLQGYDQSWSPWTKTTRKTYYNLPQGTFIFSVAARDQEGNIDPLPATSTFTINISGNEHISPHINIIYPQGGETIKDTTIPIRWNATDNIDTNLTYSISIYYSLDTGETWNPVARFLNNTGLYNWETEGKILGQCLIKLVVYDSAGNTGNDTLDSFFILSLDKETPGISLPLFVALVLVVMYIKKWAQK